MQCLSADISRQVHRYVRKQADVPLIPCVPIYLYALFYASVLITTRSINPTAMSTL